MEIARAFKLKHFIGAILNFFFVYMTNYLKNSFLSRFKGNIIAVLSVWNEMAKVHCDSKCFL